MTLLELLRQELPKLSGWPEGADYAVQDGDGSNDIKFGAGKPSVQYECVGVWHNTERSDWGICTSELYIRDIATLADDHATAIVTREQYEATGWDGTGLPPVGCDVEYNCYPDGWVIINIVARIEGATFIEWKSGTHKGGDIIRGDFPFERVRPLRTEAERAIDEMVRLSGVSTGAAKILYDAGYRK